MNFTVWCRCGLFKGGMSESQLDAIERRLRVPLPDDYRCSCRLFTGQEQHVGFNTPGYSTNHYELLCCCF